MIGRGAARYGLLSLGAWLAAAALAAAPALAQESEGPPRGFDLEILEWAAPDTVGHPISLDVDRLGRVFVAETNRYTLGVRQSRGDRELEELELQVETVDDFKAVLIDQVERRGKFRRKPETDRTDPAYVFYSELSEEIAVYEDTDGDGLADRRFVYADGFDDWYSGPAADVFVDGDRVYLTNIPDFWRLEDEDGDGVAGANERKKIATGFGVVFSFLAHDMHGIVRGPDGRLYWSIGDRSYHVETEDGRVLRGKSGAVFRCNPDGSRIELFATGLRNPQDLTFDAYGNLVTGDNNCDKGDLARIVHIVEGSDHGWRLCVQRMRAGGPWLREKMWRTTTDIASELGLGDRILAQRDPTQPAWILPTRYYLKGQGPSGAFSYPGLGLPERYDDHLFVTHCAGGGGFVQSFRLDEEGAGSTVSDFHVFIEPGPITGPSDAIFGYDGRIYSTNWGSGWELNDDASLFVAFHPESLDDPRIEATRRLVAEGFSQREIAELDELLGHVDQRVRQEAQFELAARGEAGRAALLQAARDDIRDLPARMHGVWGIAQSLRETGTEPDEAAIEAMRALLADGPPRLQELTAQTIGDLGVDALSAELIERLGDQGDGAARVQFQAAVALGKLGEPRAFEPLLAVLAQNQDVDLYLRHGVVMGLVGIGDVDRLTWRHEHGSRSVRLGALLALRRLGVPAVALFLDDADFQIASEAARAVYDGRHLAAFEALAAYIDGDPRHEFNDTNSEAILRRSLAANQRLGHATAARRLLRFAADPRYPEEKRRSALDLLAEWDAPPPKDPVWYDWWPHEEREQGVALGAYLEAIEAGVVERIRAGSELLAERVGLLDGELVPDRPTEYFVDLIGDAAGNENLRMEALRNVVARSPDEARTAIQAALKGGTPRMRAVARSEWVTLDADAALDALEAVFAADSTAEIAERQAAVRDLARFGAPEARIVRVDLAGEDRILSIAELRVFSAGENVALSGAVTQSSVAWDGPPELAIDDDTMGDHGEKPQVTHTETEADPWWELELPASVPVEVIELWNRTDNGHHTRLRGARLAVLGEDRAERWSTVIEDPSEERARFELGAGGAETGARADRRLLELTQELAAGRLDPALELDVVEAAGGRGTPELIAALEAYTSGPVEDDSLGRFRAAIEGGDPVRGEQIFRYDDIAQCMRCHAPESAGDTVGPPLSGVGLAHDRRYFVESLIEPNAVVADGYGTVSVKLKTGRDVVGVLRSSGRGRLGVLVGDQLVTLFDHEIARRSQSMSAMPSVADKLELSAIRDVVAYLATQRTAPPVSAPIESPVLRETSPYPRQPSEGFGLLTLLGMMVGAFIALLAVFFFAIKRRS